MTIILDLRCAAGTLFVDESVGTGEPIAQRLRGFVDIHWTDDERGRNLRGHARLEIAACVEAEDDNPHHYLVDFAGYSGVMFPQRDKPSDTFPDYSGRVGPFEVTGWKRGATSSSTPHIELLITKAVNSLADPRTSFF